MERRVCITAIEGNTGFLIAELLLTNSTFKNVINSVTGLSLNTDADRCKELSNLGATIAAHNPGRVRQMTNTLRETKADTICLVPPAHRDKLDITTELIQAAKRANIPNVCLISTAGADLAERDAQPRLREFVDMESLFMATKGDPSTAAGRSPVIIRAGFYAENLLLYAPQCQEEGMLPIPIGRDHKFPLVALGDIALLAAHVLCGKGKYGFSDKHRGQLMAMTGPSLVNGDELATCASQALGVDLKFDDISDNETRRILRNQSDIDPSEIQLILEYYSLVREGKTNYISTTAFHDVTGGHPQELLDFFKTYKEEFLPKKTTKRRKTEGK
ncbi:hypothetical protein Egran_05590 [Elaphomyces granulatus]|uniref:NmrA-like domain-containing protein n=1 Tax=Elaphomyces granulatus TaxID=519963 RepID=A0A232LR90_9EURO|nr:hypothetical protein Egran_05590 [Elaphomyces granulatus]